MTYDSPSPRGLTFARVATAARAALAVLIYGCLAAFAGMAAASVAFK